MRGNERIKQDSGRVKSTGEGGERRRRDERVKETGGEERTIPTRGGGMACDNGRER